MWQNASLKGETGGRSILAKLRESTDCVEVAEAVSNYDEIGQTDSDRTETSDVVKPTSSIGDNKVVEILHTSEACGL